MKYLWATGVFSIGELFALIIFGVLKKAFGPTPNSPAYKWSWTKGVLERVTMLTGLLGGFPQILIAFGAFKLGTRLKEEQNSHISNTYFLTGNLISVLLAMIYAIIIKSIW
jgi:hypothetical protein